MDITLKSIQLLTSQCRESPIYLFYILMTYFKTMPKNVIYDNGCNLGWELWRSLLANNFNGTMSTLTSITFNQYKTLFHVIQGVHSQSRTQFSQDWKSYSWQNAHQEPHWLLSNLQLDPLSRSWRCQHSSLRADEFTTKETEINGCLLQARNRLENLNHIHVPQKSYSGTKNGKVNFHRFVALIVVSLKPQIRSSLFDAFSKDR